MLGVNLRESGRWSSVAAAALLFAVVAQVALGLFDLRQANERLTRVRRGGAFPTVVALVDEWTSDEMGGFRPMGFTPADRDAVAISITGKPALRKHVWYPDQTIDEDLNALIGLVGRVRPDASPEVIPADLAGVTHLEAADDQRRPQIMLEGLSDRPDVAADLSLHELVGRWVMISRARRDLVDIRGGRPVFVNQGGLGDGWPIRGSFAGWLARVPLVSESGQVSTARGPDAFIVLPDSGLADPVQNGGAALFFNTAPYVLSPRYSENNSLGSEGLADAVVTLRRAISERYPDRLVRYVVLGAEAEVASGVGRRLSPALVWTGLMLFVVAVINLGTVGSAEAALARRAIGIRRSLGASRESTAAAQFGKLLRLVWVGGAIGLVPSLAWRLPEILASGRAASVVLGVTAAALLVGALAAVVGAVAPVRIALSVSPVEAVRLRALVRVGRRSFSLWAFLAAVATLVAALAAPVALVPSLADLGRAAAYMRNAGITALVVRRSQPPGRPGPEQAAGLADREALAEALAPYGRVEWYGVERVSLRANPGPGAREGEAPDSGLAPRREVVDAVWASEGFLGTRGATVVPFEDVPAGACQGPAAYLGEGLAARWRVSRWADLAPDRVALDLGGRSVCVRGLVQNTTPDLTELDFDRQLAIYVPLGAGSADIAPRLPSGTLWFDGSDERALARAREIVSEYFAAGYPEAVRPVLARPLEEIERLASLRRIAAWLSVAVVGSVFVLLAASVASAIMAELRERQREYRIRRAIGADLRALRRMVTIGSLRWAVPAAAIGGLLGVIGIAYLPLPMRAPVTAEVVRTAVAVAGLGGLVAVAAALGASWLAVWLVGGRRLLED